ncbi:MAG: SCO family protein [Caulobacteraceae bacterium]|nr:SCO family protein [Caulobacteraceae bacterium]
MDRRIALAGLVVAALGLASVVAFETRSIGSPAVVSGPSTRIGGPLILVDQHGRVITDRDLEGKPTVVFFGFTYCPEVCPTTLTALTAWMKALGPDADKLNVVYVTIDPERDTPKQLALYLSSFDPRIRGLTGTPAQIPQIAHEYGVYYQKIPLSGGGYTMDHSSAVYLMDARSAFEGVIGYQEPTPQALAQLRALVRA